MVHKFVRKCVLMAGNSHDVCRSWLRYRTLYAVSACRNKRNKADELKIVSQPPSKVETDMIGPADPHSNLQSTIYYIPPDDTPLEQRFRKQRQDVYQWNHKFWSNHNKKFAEEKKRFTQAKLHQLGEHLDDGSKRVLTAEEMSEFYKRFLEENFEVMEKYHREWYRKNNSLTFLNLVVYIQRAWMGLKRRFVVR